MKTGNQHIENILRRHMSVHAVAPHEPDPLLVLEARLRIMNKKDRKTRHLHLYQLALSAVLVLTSFIFISAPGDSGAASSTYHCKAEALRSQSITTSAMSSTLLTSIPTLRN